MQSVAVESFKSLWINSEIATSGICGSRELDLHSWIRSMLHVTPREFRPWRRRCRVRIASSSTKTIPYVQALAGLFLKRPLD